MSNDYPTKLKIMRKHKRIQTLLLLGFALLTATPLLGQEAKKLVDLRGDYDVIRYELELAVIPETKTLEGVGAIIGVADVDGLRLLQVDLYDLYEILSVTDAGGKDLAFTRIADGLKIVLAKPLAKGAEFAVKIHYRGHPKGGGFDGFHWKTSADGKPWINTACQGLGAHYWYPCKASFFHPEDKPAAFYMSAAVPKGLFAVGNGKLVDERLGAFEWFDFSDADTEYTTYTWRHEYPLETYAASLNIANYTQVHQQLKVSGNDQEFLFSYYVLPENAEKAAIQFKQVPELLRIYSEAFGSFPFPDSKFALVESNVWGMEHSTAVSYGSSYPAWCEQAGAKDRYASRNKWFDYILVHEVAHEWWGNGVSAEHWGHFWIHEGFGTYAEGVYIEGTQGREAADKFFKQMGRGATGSKGVLFRGDHPESGDAYSGLIYSKGATVLHTLRSFVNDDEMWWDSLRSFNREFRYGNATTEDFAAVLNRVTKQDWTFFFEQWVYGAGAPKLTVEVEVAAKLVTVRVANPRGQFRVPIDIAWDDDGEEATKRLWFDPGQQETSFDIEGTPKNVRVQNLDRILGSHKSSVSEKD
jgi:aminopeptidase N